MATIKVRCKSCKTLLKFPPEKAGKRVRCPECDEIVRVPEEEEDEPPKEAIQKKKPAAAAPPPTPAPPAPAAADDDEEGGAKTYGVVAPAETPKYEHEEDRRESKKKDAKVDFKSRIKKRVIHEADQWQKITSALMLAIIGVCLMGLVWLFNAITFVNGWFFNNAAYSIQAEKLLIQRVGEPVQTGNFTIKFGAKGKELPDVLTSDLPVDELTGFVSKEFLLKWAADTKYRVLVQSTDFDAFIRIANSNGRTLAADDNSGGGNDALLEFTPPAAGTYKVIVSSSVNFPYTVNRNAFVVALAYGTLEFGRAMMIIGALAALAASAVFMLAYFICLAVPNVAGTRSLALALVVLSIVNLLLIFLLKLLPATGALGYIMLPFALPELGMTPSNLTRLQSLHIFWSVAPFWEMFASILFSALLHGEVVLFCIFLRSVSIALKEEYLQEKALGLIQLGFGVLFIYFTFQVVSITGTSTVLLVLLRVIYGVYLGFYIGYTIYLATALLTARQKIAALLEPEEGAETTEDEEEDEEDEYEDDGDEEEDEEDEDGDDDDD